MEKTKRHIHRILKVLEVNKHVSNVDWDSGGVEFTVSKVVYRIYITGFGVIIGGYNLTKVGTHQPYHETIMLLLNNIRLKDLTSDVRRLM